MVIDPTIAIKEKWITFPIAPLDKSQLQPNGIDLRLYTLGFAPMCGFELTECNGYRALGKPEDLKTQKRPVLLDGKRVFALKRWHAYVVTAYEYVSIPKGIVALIYGRSTLNRNGVLIRSSVYDSGFKGFAGFSVYPFVNVYLEPGVRVAQILFFEAGSSSLYTGQYGDSR